jgi:hypothetical protein
MNPILVFKQAITRIREYPHRLLLLGTLSFAYFFIFSTHIAYAVIPNWLTATLSILKYIFYAVAIITIVGMLLWGAGILFDSALQNTVLNFTKLIEGTGGGSLLDSLYKIWTTSRDIANILIIGIFVYIALSKIIGRAENFNKLIVSLLSVAILINFSFFFTQVVVDISNWTAIQVYTTMSPDAAANDLQSGGVRLSETIVHNMGGVEMGIGVWKNAASNFSDNMTFSGFAETLPRLVVVTILSFITAILFFRMAFILIGRWIVLILLMATSSLAFVAMLIPSLRKYWIYWSRGLMYNAIVAPLLLLLLWAVTILMAAVSKVFNASWNPSSKALSDLSAAEVTTFADGLIGFTITVGLLWAAIRIATALSHTAAESTGGLGRGINNILGSMQGRTIGAAFGGLGMLGRNTVGKGFAGMEEGAKAKAGVGGLRGSFANMRSKMYGSIAGSSFDARNTKTAQGLGKQAGVNLGKGITQSFSQITAKKEKEQKALAEIYDKKINEERLKGNDMKNDMERSRREETERIETTKSELEKTKNDLGKEFTTKEEAVKKNSESQKNITEQGDKLVEEMKVKVTEQDKLEKEIITEADAQTGEMRTQEARINQIKDEITNKSQRLSELKEKQGQGLRSTPANTPDQINLLSSQIEEAEKERVERVAKLEQLRTSNSDQERRLEAIRTEKAELKTKIAELTSPQAIAERKEKLAKLETEGEQLIREKEDINRRLIEATSRVDTNKTVSDARLEELGSIQQKFVESRAAEAGKFASKLSSVRKLKPKKMGEGSLEDQISQIKSDIEARRNKINSLTKATPEKEKKAQLKTLQELEVRGSELIRYRDALANKIRSSIGEAGLSSSERESNTKKKKEQESLLEMLTKGIEGADKKSPDPVKKAVSEKKQDSASTANT